jgi:hypothetical protein
MTTPSLALATVCADRGWAGANPSPNTHSRQMPHHPSPTHPRRSEDPGQQLRTRHLVGLFLAVAAERTSCRGCLDAIVPCSGGLTHGRWRPQDLRLGTTTEILESDISSYDARMVARIVGSVTWRKVDDAARDIAVLVGVVAGADPVVTVRDLRGPVGTDIAAHEQDR